MLFKEWKIFCSFETEGGGNCTNAAVGEVPIYVSNNPLPGKAMMLPICQYHLDNAPKE